jgi:hypothetical protein
MILNMDMVRRLGKMDLGILATGEKAMHAALESSTIKMATSLKALLRVIKLMVRAVTDRKTVKNMKASG